LSSSDRQQTEDGTGTLFDIPAALLAKHAQHVVLIQFPFALFIVGVVFDFLAQKTKKRGLLEAAFYNVLGAAIFALPAVVTGILAWQLQLEGQKLKGILLMHVVQGSTSTILIWVAWALHVRARRQWPKGLPVFRLVLETAAVLIVGLTGHLGGFSAV
jgi:uncharacterized membrane protein